MKNKCILAFILALLLLTLTACPKPPVQKDPVEDDPVQEDAVLSVDFATEEALSKYDSYIDKYVEAEYVLKVLISTNTMIKEFRFFELGYREEGEDIVFFEDSLLFALDELTADKPLVVGVSFPGVLPTKGFSYVDTTKATKSFCIAESGEDGSLFLLEF